MQILKEHSPQSTPGDIKEQMPGVAWSGNREPGVAIGMVGCPLLFLPSIVTYDPPHGTFKSFSGLCQVPVSGFPQM